MARFLLTGEFVVQAKNLLQGDSMAYQMDAADANVVLNPFVTAAAQKGIFFLLSLSNCLRYSSTGARSRDFGASINFNFHFRMA